MRIVKAAKGTPQELEMLVERRIDELENGIESSFVYPEDLEDLENGEYESHATEPINASAIVRPVGYHSWGVYLPDGHDHAEKLFECLSEDECYDWIAKNQKIIKQKESEMNSVEGASGSPQELQMLVEDRIEDLENDINSSFVYPEDLEALEDGEYESHATEPINASSYADNFEIWLDENADDITTAEVLDYFANTLGWDVFNDKQVRDYADAVAEYIDIAREAEGEYSLADWYRDTKQNYPEEIEQFEHRNSVNSSVTFTEIELEPEEEDYLYEIAERYSTSNPVSGDWNTETEHEMKTIMDEFGVDAGEAKYLMKKYLGFDDDMFQGVEASVGAVAGHAFKAIASEVLKYLADKGFDIASEAVRKYADKAANYIEKARETTNYSISEWYKDTKHDYPEDLRELPKVTAAEDVPGIDFDDEYEETFEERYKPAATAISDWLGEHEQVYEDVCNFFGCSIDEDVADYADADQLIDWISKHKRLSEDFSNYFGYEWIEGCTNTANIMAGDIAMDLPVEPDMLPAYIANLEGHLYTLFTDRYTCIRDVEARYIGKNNGIFVTIKFEPPTGEDDMHVSYAASIMPKDSQAAAYKIYAETIEDWGDELADTERIYDTTL